MKSQKLSTQLRNLILLFILSITHVANARPQMDVSKAVSKLQSQWAVATYDLKNHKQDLAFKKLILKAESASRTYPDAAEIWVWTGIIKSSYAGVKGGLGALGLVKESRLALEKALTLNADVLQGSAYTSLGTLYFKVPGWPIAFGDDDKAEQLLKQALVINPTGIDANYFYAMFLEEDGNHREAKNYLIKAQQAAPRPARPLADTGRRNEISTLLASIEEELKYEKSQLNEFE